MHNLAHEGLDAQTTERLQRQASVAMARRAAFGPPAYAVLVLAFTMGTDFRRSSPSLALALTVATLIVSAVRHPLGSPEPWIRRLGFAGWHRAYLVTTLAGFALFGGYIAAAIFVLGIGVPTCIMMMLSTGLVASIAHAFAPGRLLVGLGGALLLGPLVVAALATGTPAGHIVTLLLVVDLGFMLFLSTTLRREYWQSVTVQAQLQQRGEELVRSQQQVARDVSERNRMRAQLALSERLASIGTLAAGIGHEINNPLTYVRLNLEHVIEELRSRPTIDAALASELADVACEAREGADRVQGIVSDLRTFSRVSESTGAVDVRKVVDATLKMATAEVRHRARVVLDLAEVPMVVGDAGRLGQVLLNLLVNAAQAMPDVSIDRNTIRITTRTDAAGDVLLQVSDTGCGIPQHLLARIFDPFFTTKPVGLGTGLGLSICHNIVRSFGGDISVRSEVGRGTRFSVLLRRAPDEVRTPRVSVPPRDTPSGASVMVVDDEPSVGRAIKRVLRDFQVVVESTGRQALARLVAGEHFDLVLCDLMMPEMSGMDLYEEVKERAPGHLRRFIFMTGGAFTDRARAFLNDVPNERIEKPLEPRRLRATVREHVEATRRC